MRCRVANRVDLRMQSGPAYRLLRWDLDYYRDNIDYDTQNDIMSEAITGSARRLVTPTVGLLAELGYEEYDTDIPGTEFNGSNWKAGIEWTPSPRTRVAGSAGERFYGNTYDFDFSTRTRRTTFRVGYRESITTARNQLLIPATASTAAYLDTLFLAQYPDAVARQVAVEEFIARTGLPANLNSPINFFTTQLFLLKRWEVSAGILGARNVVLANVFKDSREGLIEDSALPGSGDFARSNSVDQTGVSFEWNLQLTAQDSWNLRGSYTRNAFPFTGQVDYLTLVQAGLSHQFQPRLSGSLTLSRQLYDSNQRADFTEHVIFAGLSARF